MIQYFSIRTLDEYFVFESKCVHEIYLWILIAFIDYNCCVSFHPPLFLERRNRTPPCNHRIKKCAVCVSLWGPVPRENRERVTVRDSLLLVCPRKANSRTLKINSAWLLYCGRITCLGVHSGLQCIPPQTTFNPSP